MMAGFFFLASMVLGWALGCGLMYVFLRWLNVSFALGVRCAGAWALAVWVLIYVGVATPPPTRFGVSSPNSFKLALGIGAVIFGGLGLGGLFLRFVPHKNELWWHDVLFCALYLGGAFVWGELLLLCWPVKSGPLYAIAQWNGKVGDAHLLMLCAWVFPLGAPLIELAGRNLWRLQREMTSEK